jgi:hypothetical protein
MKSAHQCMAGSDAALSAENSKGTAADALLFLFELANSTGDPSFAEVANVAAQQLAKGWSSSEAKRAAVRAGNDPAAVDDLSRWAFALAEAWKITRNPPYRGAGLSIIQYFANTQPAPYSDADPSSAAQP